MSPKSSGKDQQSYLYPSTEPTTEGGFGGVLKKEGRSPFWCGGVEELATDGGREVCLG